MIRLLTACAQSPQLYTCVTTSTCDGVVTTEAAAHCGTEDETREWIVLDMGLCEGAPSERCQEWACSEICGSVGDACQP